MTTTVTFNPPPNEGQSFAATLDGAPCTVAVYWNLFGRRWWFSVYNAGGDLIGTAPAVSSSGAMTSINLIGAWFKTSTLHYYDQAQTFVVSP